MESNTVFFDSIQDFSGNSSNAGYDLRSDVDLVLKAGSRSLVKTSLFIEMPENMYAQIGSRSGLALKNWVNAEGGVIDASYRGEIGVILHNYHPTDDFIIKKGDRIAQLLFIPIIHPKLIKKDRNEHIKTDRQEGGFGSSGVN